MDYENFILQLGQQGHFLSQQELGRAAITLLTEARNVARGGIEALALGHWDRADLHGAAQMLKDRVYQLVTLADDEDPSLVLDRELTRILSRFYGSSQIIFVAPRQGLGPLVGKLTGTRRTVSAWVADLPEAEIFSAIATKHRFLESLLSLPEVNRVDVREFTDQQAATKTTGLASQVPAGPGSYRDSTLGVPGSIQPRLLKIFLAHASEDKLRTKNISQQLKAIGVDVWLDEERLLPGLNWRQQIRKAVESADIVLVCLSEKAVTKTGYIQQEIRFALDIADKQPEESIFLVPIRLEECTVPDRLSNLHWVDHFKPTGWRQLVLSLRKRAQDVGAIVPILEGD